MIEGADFPNYTAEEMAGAPITVATLLWDANEGSYHFSRCYDESWVERLYRGFRDNLKRPLRFVCFTDRHRDLPEAIEQIPIEGEPCYASCIQPYKLDVPMILVGLDTIVTGNCDELADYCFYGDRIAVPLDPFYGPEKVCNGVALVPAGQRAAIYDAHPAEMNDMEWIRSLHAAHKVAVIDTLFPGQVSSYKGTVRKGGLGDTRICYFHGEFKPPELMNVGWIARAWEG